LNSGWDNDLLALELGELSDDGFDLDLLGFGDTELSLLDDNEIVETQTHESKTKEIDTDNFEMAHKCPKCGFEYD
jgi:hypothetical protein